MLSDNEKKQLAEIEKVLLASDPKIGKKLNPIQRISQQTIFYILGTIFGYGVIFIALLSKLLLLGVLGFLISLVSLVKTIKLFQKIKEDAYLII